MSKLKAIEEINKEIKDIASITENISVTVTAAMQEARQSSITSAGFSLVARELRVFSEKMAAALQRLSGLIDWQLEVNASKQYLASGSGVPATAYMNGQADIDEIEQLIVCQLCELRIGMLRTAKQCATGLLIARSVDMEAALDVAMTPELVLITQHVEEAIDNIALRVRQLESRLAEIGLWKNKRLFGSTDGLIIEDTAALSSDSQGSEVF